MSAGSVWLMWHSYDGGQHGGVGYCFENAVWL